MKAYFLLITFTFLFHTANCQSNISISDVRQYVKKVQYSLKDDNVNMYVSSDYDGKRWIYIKDIRIDGLRSDEGYLSLEYAVVYIKMLYLAINYDLEEPISLADLPQLLSSKGIKGVQFVTKNNEFYFKLNEIMEKIKIKTN